MVTRDFSLQQVSHQPEMQSKHQLSSLVHQLEQHVHGVAKLNLAEHQQLLQEVRLAMH